MGVEHLVDEPNVGGRDRIARAALAVGFAVVAVQALRTGRRARSLVAGVLAVGFALSVVTCFCTVNRVLGVDTTDEG